MYRVDSRNSRHRKRQEPSVQLPQTLDPELVPDPDGVRQVQPVGVELGQRRRRDDDAGGLAAQLDEVEGAQEGLAERRRLAVVGRGQDGDEVNLGRGLGDGDGAAGVAFTCRDGHCVEWLWCCHCCCHFWRIRMGWL